MSQIGQTYDYLFKMIMIGNSSVGKSTLLLRFADGTFNENFLPTIGVDFKIRNIEIDKKNIKLQIWDTAGQERFQHITTSYYRGAHGVIITYDITDQQSFQQIPQWLKECDQNGLENGVKMIIGNKIDLEEKRVIPQKEAIELAQKFDCSYMETSAKTAKNVDKAFIALAKQIKKSGIYENDKERRQSQVQGQQLQQSSGEDKKKKSCC